MPAKSEAQRKLFGLALAVKRGIKSRDDVSDSVLKIVDDMTEDEIRDFAVKESETSDYEPPKEVIKPYPGDTGYALVKKNYRRFIWTWNEYIDKNKK